MCDKRFIAEHRGGPLKKEQHYQLIEWACDCSEHILHLQKNVDERLKNAINVAHEWKQGNASVGKARKASLDAIAVRMNLQTRLQLQWLVSAGHAVATAHMVDHSLGTAWYALKAVKNAGKSVEAEKKWQDEQLPSEVKELVLTARKVKRFHKI